MQHPFSIRRLLGLLLVAASVLLFDQLLGRLPDRAELGRRLVPVEFERIDTSDTAPAPFEQMRIWRVRVDDPRFGGVSALALDRDRLVALSDSGVLAILPKPGTGGGTAVLDELPAGPGSAGFKVNRDSEALLRDPAGRGWWVAFEQWHQLWLFDPGFDRPLRRVRLLDSGWPRNRGVEALTEAQGKLLVIPENGAEILEIQNWEVRRLPIAGKLGAVSDAARSAGGDLLVVERKFTWKGLAISLVELRRTGPGYQVGRRTLLPLGPFDNVEALAVEPLAGGGSRLWLMTDDNGQKPLRTLLIAVDVPPDP